MLCLRAGRQILEISIFFPKCPKMTKYWRGSQPSNIKIKFLNLNFLNFNSLTTVSPFIPNNCSPLAIFFIVIFALCYWLCCNSKLCCDCPEFNHRSDENGRYGTSRPAMRKDRFQATCGYPHEPNVDPHQKYCGPNRLHRYKEPVIAIVDENDKILEDTYTLTNSY